MLNCLRQKPAKQLLGRGGLSVTSGGGARQKPGRETGPDANTLKLRAGLQVQQGAGVLSRETEAEPTHVVLADVAGIGEMQWLYSVGTGKWDSPSSTDCPLWDSKVEAAEWTLLGLR